VFIQTDSNRIPVLRTYCKVRASVQFIGLNLSDAIPDIDSYVFNRPFTSRNLVWFLTTMRRVIQIIRRVYCAVRFIITYSKHGHRYAFRGTTLMRPTDFTYPSSASEHKERTENEMTGCLYPANWGNAFETVWRSCVSRLQYENDMFKEIVISPKFRLLRYSPIMSNNMVYCFISLLIGALSATEVM
jgi:hypothetical protein